MSSPEQEEVDAYQPCIDPRQYLRDSPEVNHEWKVQPPLVLSEITLYRDNAAATIADKS